MVRDEMVHVVTALPPANGQTAAQIADEDANERVGRDVVCDAPVTGVVGRKHDLLPEEPEQAGRRGIPAIRQGDGEAGEEDGVPDHLLPVLRHATIVEAFFLYSLVQRLEFAGDATLSRGVQRRVLGKVGLKLPLDKTSRVRCGRRLACVWRRLALVQTDRAGGCAFGAVPRIFPHILPWLQLVLLAEITTLDGRDEIGPCPFYPADAEAVHELNDLGRVGAATRITGVSGRRGGQQVLRD